MQVDVIINNNHYQVHDLKLPITSYEARKDKYGHGSLGNRLHW